jgi:hypothetical protein
VGVVGGGVVVGVYLSTVKVRYFLSRQLNFPIARVHITTALQHYRLRSSALTNAATFVSLNCRCMLHLSAHKS